MKNSLVKSKSSMLFPLPCPARRQTFDDKHEKMIIRDKKIDSIDSLSRIIDKLHIDESMKCNIANKLVQEDLKTREEITESMHDLKKMAIPLYDIDGMSPQELQTSLRRIKETPQQPFSFLMDISKVFADEDQLSAEARKQRPSEIDIQLAAVAKRIESSKVLLEKAKSRVEEICLRVKRDDIICQSLDTYDYRNDTLKMEKQS